jgi:hypothetical protein
LEDHVQNEAQWLHLNLTLVEEGKFEVSFFINSKDIVDQLLRLNFVKFVNQVKFLQGFHSIEVFVNDLEELWRQGCHVLLLEYFMHSITLRLPFRMISLLKETRFSQ